MFFLNGKIGYIFTTKTRRARSFWFPGDGTHRQYSLCESLWIKTVAGLSKQVSSACKCFDPVTFVTWRCFELVNAATFRRVKDGEKKGIAWGCCEAVEALALGVFCFVGGWFGLVGFDAALGVPGV